MLKILEKNDRIEKVKDILGEKKMVTLKNVFLTASYYYCR